MPKPLSGEPSPVRKLRKARELTQAQLAELAGTDGSSVSEVERGRRGVWTESFARIAAVLNAPVDDLRESHIQWVQRRWPAGAAGQTSSEAHPLRTHDASEPDLEEEISRMGLHGDKLVMVRGIVDACGKPETLGRIAMQLRLLLRDDEAMTPELDEALLRLQYTASVGEPEAPPPMGPAP